MFASLYSYWPATIAIVQGPPSTAILLPAGFKICLEVLQLTMRATPTLYSLEGDDFHADWTHAALCLKSIWSHLFLYCLFYVTGLPLLNFLFLNNKCPDAITSTSSKK